MVTFELEYKKHELFSDVETYQKSFLEFKSRVTTIIHRESCPKFFKKPVVSYDVRDGNYYLKIRTCCYEYSKHIAQVLKERKLN
jgi:hypothetical protein